MFASNEQGAEKAFGDWMNQGDDSPPTNADVVAYDKIDVELLHHLAAFMYRRGRNDEKLQQGDKN